MGGGERWLLAEKEDVNINGTIYRLDWTRAAPDEIDFRTHRNDFSSMIVVLPDPIMEERANAQAATQVAARLCGTDKVSTVSSDRYGEMYVYRMRCHSVGVSGGR